MKHNHYFKDVSKYDFIDVYRVIDLYKITDPCIQHAIKKLLVPGDRGLKNIEKDIQDAIDSLVRWQVMRAEEKRPYYKLDELLKSLVEFNPTQIIKKQGEESVLQPTNSEGLYQQPSSAVGIRPHDATPTARQEVRSGESNMDGKTGNAQMDSGEDNCKCRSCDSSMQSKTTY
jgi:hypothetical protein